MCDFHSICVRLDGAIAHVMSNSHSQAVKEAGWIENDAKSDNRFVEAEWDGQGNPPTNWMSLIRGEPNERQIAAVKAHYTDLHITLLTGKISARFTGVSYADVRWRVAGNLNRRI